MQPSYFLARINGSAALVWGIVAVISSAPLGPIAAFLSAMFFAIALVTWLAPPRKRPKQSVSYPSRFPDTLSPKSDALDHLRSQYLNGYLDTIDYLLAVDSVSDAPQSPPGGRRALNPGNPSTVIYEKASRGFVPAATPLPRVSMPTAGFPCSMCENIVSLGGAITTPICSGLCRQPSGH